MPRKISSSVHKYFFYNSDRDISLCRIGDCRKEIKGKHASNLAKHLRLIHNTEFHLMLQENKTIKRNEITKIDNNLLQICVNLVTVHGRPLDLMNDIAFKSILNMVKLESKVNINSQIVREAIVKRAESMRCELRKQLNDKLVCLKIDIASCHLRSFLGVHVLFIKNGKLEVRTLHVAELFHMHAIEILKDKLMFIQNKFGIELKKNYSITVDKGSNISKMIRLVDHAVKRSVSEDLDEDYEHHDDNTQTTDKVEELIFEDYSDTAVVDRFTVSGIRCAAYTLELAIQDYLKTASVQTIIQCARRVVNELKSSASHTFKKPILESTTRWGSTIDMLERVLDLRTVCSSSYNHNLYLSDITWNSIEVIIKVLKGPRKMDKKLQTEHFTPGDFYLNWLSCKLDVQKIGTPLAITLCSNMEQREELLFASKPFLSAIFLDPRVKFMLNHEQQTTAIENLYSTWVRLEAYCLTDELSGLIKNQATHTFSKNKESHLSNLLTDFLEIVNKSYENVLKNTIKHSPRQNYGYDEIEMMLKEFYEKEPRLPPDANILNFWEEKKMSMAQLSALANVALAVPSSQVSLERLYSSLDFVTNKVQINFKNDITDDILFINNNYKL